MARFTVVIEDKVGNEEDVIVDASSCERAETLACEYAELSQWGAGGWEATDVFTTMFVVTEEIVAELKKDMEEE